MKPVVFDLGGTLMEYVGMPLCWTDYYETGFRQVAHGLSLSPSPADLERSAELMISFNPRVNPREVEYSPEHIFQSCLAHWRAPNLSFSRAAELFFEGLHLEPHIFPDVLPCLDQLKRAGYFLACLTDLPTAMPDGLFRRGISPLLEQLDLYVSSGTCGYRKPHRAGLDQIAKDAGVPVEDLIFIGDEEKDLLTAKRAGCRFLKIDREPGNSADLVTLEGLLEHPIFQK